MKTQHGDFVWYELMTTDADAAQEFYGPLFNWEFGDGSFDDNGYRAITNPHIGGFLPLTEEMTAGGAQPAWLGYVHVSDFEKSKAAFVKAGGTEMFAAEVPDVGPFAMVSDPQGAMLYLIEDKSGKDTDAFSAYEPKVGYCAWNELMAGDVDAAKAFYNEQFGWVVGESMDMGPMGQYDMLKNGETRDFMFGAVMKKPDEVPMSFWAFYFRVPDIDEAEAYVKDKGGQILNGPMEIPGGEYVFQGTDPQGAFFSVIGIRG